MVSKKVPTKTQLAVEWWKENMVNIDEIKWTLKSPPDLSPNECKRCRMVEYQIVGVFPEVATIWS